MASHDGCLLPDSLDTALSTRGGDVQMQTDEAFRPGRRQVLAAGAAMLAMPAFVRARAASAHVVVVGGGFGGATAARYLRQLAPEVKVTLVEPATRFYTCPFSNLYLGGLRTFESIGHGYDGLRADGVEVVHARAEDVDVTARTVRLSTDAR